MATDSEIYSSHGDGPNNADSVDPGIVAKGLEHAEQEQQNEVEKQESHCENEALVNVEVLHR